MKQIAVISGKGGTGKTSVTAALASLGPAKSMADCDVDAADLHLILNPQVQETHEFWSGQTATIDPDTCTACGLCAEHCRYGAVIAGPEAFRIQKEHCEGCGVCAFVCPTGAATMHDNQAGRWFVSQTRFGPMAHAELFPGEENSGKLVTQVRKISQELAESTGADLVLVDGPPGIGCPVIASLSGIDLILAVAEPTLSATHDLKRLLQLAEHFKIPATVLVNKTDVNPEQTVAIETFCMERSIPLAGRLPYDPAFTKAQTAHQAVTEFDPQGLGKTMHAIWNTIAKLL